MDITRHHANELATAGVTIVRLAAPAAAAASASAALHYLDEKRDALEKWAAHLKLLVAHQS